MDINPLRLRSTLEQINSVALNENGGVDRVALSDADKAGRDLLAGWMRELNLDVRVDDIGTMYGHCKGTESGAPVVFGSHLDSVPNGGHYDGSLGVIAGLEIMRVVREFDIRTRRPLELVNFTNEEGARFEPAQMASGTLADQFATDYVHTRTDREGAIFRDELARIGYLGTKENRMREASAFLELHVEQGPVLEAKEFPIGVVEGIQGIMWLEVVISGERDHAGPTPMSVRRDALVAAGRVVTEVQALAHRIGEPAVATVGRIQASPGIINVIPDEVVLSVDIRHPDEDVLGAMETAVRRLVSRAADAERVDGSVDHIWTSPPTAFDRNTLRTVESVAKDQGVQYCRITAGAGHDSKYMAEIAPTAMIFVRSLGGKSHSPEEKSDWADIVQAVRVLLYTVLRIAQ